MIVAVGSLQREVTQITRAGDHTSFEAFEDVVAYRPEDTEHPAIVLAGSGIDRARKATEWAIDEFNPEALISFGFCSATRENQEAGDIVIADQVVLLPGTPFEWTKESVVEPHSPDRGLLLSARTAVETGGLDYHHGRIVTVTKLTTTGGTKSWIGKTIDAAAVNTSSHGVVSAATKVGVPWVAISCVLDRFDQLAPKIVDREGAGPRERGISAYARHLFRNPSDLPELIKLNRASAQASSSIKVFFDEFIKAISRSDQVPAA